MKIKKFFMYIGILVIIILIVGIGYFLLQKKETSNNNNEYTPEEELSDDMLRQTIVTLYFMDSESSEISPEARRIDSKILLNNPYEEILNLLIDGPKNDKLLKLIPEDTKIIRTTREGDKLIIDFSKEFIEEQNLGKKQEELIVKSIVYTLTELTEINKVQIMIEGEENKQFPDGELNFEKDFSR